MENINEVMELSAQDLDLVAGGATRVVGASTHELVDIQESGLKVGRDGITSFNRQATDNFSAALFEFTQTGK
ncbi:MAG: hypothetical protein ACKO24_01715 [Leptolyngbyaceae cyanobacterium]